MKVVWSWLKAYVDLDGVRIEDLAERWTLAGLEVDAIDRIGGWWDRERLLVGAVTRVEPHPDADRLVLAWVDYGAGAPHRVVTGAPNLLHLRGLGDLPRPLKVVFAREGCELFDGHAEGWRKITLKGKPVRGIMSDAMVCSEKEIGLSEAHEGILILDDDAPVGAPLVDVLGDAVIDLDLTANYAYAANMVGLARETAALLERPFAEPIPEVPAGPGDAGDYVSIDITDASLCARYTARIVRDVRVGPSPAWLQQRLARAGMRPISNVVDITNYTMLEWGEPLHAFDYDRLVERARAAGGGLPAIAVRLARPGERLVTLDGQDRALDPDMLLIADAAGPIAIAGVMGGLDTEVTDATTTILLEGATFDFTSVRRTSGRLKLPSESSWRFGRDVPPHLADTGSARAAGLLAELAGGTVVGGVVDVYARVPDLLEIPLPLEELERQLGVAIPREEVEAILRRLEFRVTWEGEGDGDPAADGPAPGADGAGDVGDAAVAADAGGEPAGLFWVEPPPHRVDQTITADVIEEIARVWGYDRLPATRLADPLPAQADNAAWRLEEAARDALAGGGLQEIIPYRMVAPAHETRLAAGGGGAASDETDGYVVLANPVSPERAALRRSILTGLLDAAEANLRHTGAVGLFEVGATYHRDAAAADGLPRETRRVGLLLAGPARPRTWREPADRPRDFYDAKGLVEALLARLGVHRATWSAASGADAHPSLHPGRAALVRSAAGAALGHVGELHPLVAERWHLAELVVAVADLDLDALAAAGSGAPPFAAFSSYPPVARDLAVVVDEDVPAGHVEAVIRAAGGPLLVGCELFDVYRGPQAGEGRKSLAYALAFQSPGKTLEGRSVDGLREKIVRALGREVGGEVRG